MARCCAVTLLALTWTAPGFAQVAKQPGVMRFEGKLTASDPKDAQRQTPSKIHRVNLKEGKVYTIDMVSTQFDSYLRLLDARGNQLDEDDDGGGNLNARIIFNCSKSGEYQIICTTFAAQMSGNYTLTIKESAQTVRTRTPYQALLGKRAPDFLAGITLNGKATRLSDLQGKVILLNFWEVQSGPAVAMLPKLREWHKKYEADGLAIVGLTFYNFEIGQKLAFDGKSGQLTRLPQANRATEEAMLRAFAAHHHLDYLLMALPREPAVALFDAYAVNGLPQFVIIDRQGIIRAIRVGQDAATAAALESEFKKLLKDNQ
jgi:thiol-disulfide isomerase/thioredoxin